MRYETINTQEVVKLFHQLMKPDSPSRILRLKGESKTGKSHLLTKVFPAIVQKEFQARHAILDLRYSMLTVPDILHAAYGQLDATGSSEYLTAYQKWTTRPRVSIERVLSIFSFFRISVKDSLDEIRQRDLDLTTQFVRDLATLSDKLLLLFFDTVDYADKSIQIWLVHTLLVQLSSLAHVRVVMAGTSLPDIDGSYRVLCENRELQPVRDIQEYIIYCRSLDMPLLAEQSIKDFASVFDYKPGLFVDYVLPKCEQWRVPNG